MFINPIFHNFFILLFIEILFILILIIIIVKIIKSFRKTKRDMMEYKITNFYLNKLYVLIYISIFIIFFNYLRIKRLAISFDLKKIKLLNDKFYTLTSINRLNILLIYLLIFLILIVFLLIAIKIQKFFIKEIKKLHLTLEFDQHADGRAKFSRYWFFFNQHVFDYGYHPMIAPLKGRISSVIYFIYPKIEKYDPENIRSIVDSSVKAIPLLMPIILFTYDCYFNDFVITKVFVYMVFFIPYILWYKITTFIWYETAYSEILYECYYSTKKLLYVNVPQEFEDKVTDYVFNDLYDKNNGMANYTDNPISALEFKLFLHENYVFHSTDGKKFTNGRGSGFYEEE